jgi:RNA polymerase sigma factor (sigma-70 family)
MKKEQDFSLLMQKAKAGDKEAFSLIYEAYFSQIFRYIFFRVRDEALAEDLTQAVFLKVLEKLSDYKEKNRPPLAFFYTIARNKIIDFWRKKKEIKFEEENDLTNFPDQTASVEEVLTKAGAGELLSRALETIKSDQREVIVLKFVNELSYEEIAVLLGKKEAAIRQLQSRGLKGLRKYFEKNITSAESGSLRCNI